MLSIILVTLAYILGIVWGLYLELNQVLALILFFMIFVLVILMNKDKFKKLLKYYPKVILFILIVLLGYLYTICTIQKFENKYSNGRINIELTILSPPSKTAYYYKYYVQNNKDKFLLYINIKHGREYDIGDNIIVDGFFEMPETSRNIGSFNYRRHLYSTGVYGTIKVINITQVKSNSNIILEIRNGIRKILLELFPKKYAGILNGMLVGETNDISQKTIEAFNITGTSHLLAVSGANISLLITITSVIFSKIFGKKFSEYLIIIFIIFFIIISGSSPSVTRAGIMAILNIISNIILRKPSTINNIFLSAFFILIINPLSLSNTGFILSYVATIGIIYLEKDVKSRIQKFIHIPLILETLSVTISAQIILFPILIYLFNKISIISILANLIIVPASSIITIFSIVTILFSCLKFPYISILVKSLFCLLKSITTITDILSKTRFSEIILPTPSIIVIIFFYAAIYLLLVYKKYMTYIKKSIVIIIIIYSLYSYIYYIKPNNYIEISAIDVGQGDAFYIETPRHKKILIDGGGSEIGDYDVGEKILVPYLLDRCATEIDYVFISHSHADHIEGILPVLKRLTVSTIIISDTDQKNAYMDEVIEICREKNIKIIRAKKGDTIKIDGLNFKILHPRSKDNAENLNNLSLVIQMIYGNRSMLFTGDIEKEVEKNIRGNIRSDILKVPHHGGNTSSSKEFLKKVMPKIAIISVAKNNNYDHPHLATLNRLREYATIYMTKDSGEINIRIYRNGKIFIRECIK